MASDPASSAPSPRPSSQARANAAPSMRARSASRVVSNSTCSNLSRGASAASRIPDAADRSRTAFSGCRSAASMATDSSWFAIAPRFPVCCQAGKVSRYTATDSSARPL